MSQQGRLVDNSSNFETITGNVGGPVPFDPGGNIDLVGSGSVVVTGNPGIYTLTISAIADFDWVVETGTTHSLAVNTGVFCNNGSGVTVTLPSIAPVGSTFQVVSMNAGGFTLVQQTGQQIQVGNQVTTTTSGTIVSANLGDWIEIVCSVANTSFMANIKQGNVTVS